MIGRILLAAAACAGLGCCANPRSTGADQVSTTFGGDKQLILAAGYSPNTNDLYVFAWADEPAGTNATVEVTGPLHVHCDGTFLAYPPEYGRQTPRPILNVGEGTIGLQYHAPPGSYTVTVSLSSADVQVKRSFQGAGGVPDSATNAFVVPPACVPIADTRQQLVDYIPLYVHAADLYVGYLEDPTIRSQLLPLAAAANAALPEGDTATLLRAMTIIRDTLRPVMVRSGSYYAPYGFAKDAVSLLAQAVSTA